MPQLQECFDEMGLTAIWVGSHERFYFLIPALSTSSRESRILVRSAEKPQRITGWTVGAAWGDEPSRWPEDYNNPLKDPFIQLTGRVRDPKARLRQLMFTWSNEGDGTRIYREFHGESRPTSHACYLARTIDNPAAREFEKEQRLVLTRDQADQYLDGKALALGGARVYTSFDPVLQVNKELKLEPGHPLHLSLDFNISPGMHGELGQHNETKDQITCVHEIFAPRMSVEGLVRALGHLLAKYRKDAFPELQVFGDATGSSAWAGTGQTSYQILADGLDQIKVPKWRLRVPKSNPPVVDRINSMNAAMTDIAGNVHYQVHPRCIRLIEDFKTLRRDDAGQPRKADQNLSHASDAEGYRVNYIRPARIRRAVAKGGRIIVAT